MPATIHPDFPEIPDRATPVWRYMDFTKFVSMLDNRGLYLARSDKLGDPFEGSIPPGNQAAFRRAIATHTKMSEGHIVAHEKTLTRMRLAMRRSVFVNCWHASWHESAAMWNLYAKSSEAIAVQTTLGNLFDCIESVKDNEFYLARVTYVDYETGVIPAGNMFFPFLHKRLSFKHEEEVRIIHLKAEQLYTVEGDLNEHGSPLLGIWLKADVERLIEHVYVAPNSESWFRELVERTIDRFGLKRTVKQSGLDAAPVF